MFPRIYVAAVGVMYVGLALWCTLQPEQTSDKVGFELIGGSGRSEFITVYGGLEFGIALVLLLSLRSAETLKFGVECCTLVHFALVVFRSLAFFMVRDEIGSFTYSLAKGEWLVFGLGIIACFVVRKHPLAS